MSFIVPGIVLVMALLAIGVLGGARRSQDGVMFRPLIFGECTQGPARRPIR
jgi:hypothetical protein